MAARWKMNPRVTGLARVTAGPRGSKLYDNGKEVASISALGGGFRGPVTGWYWVCGYGDALINTCNSPVATAEQAKADALAYYKAKKTALAAHPRRRQAKCLSART